MRSPWISQGNREILYLYRLVESNTIHHKFVFLKPTSSEEIGSELVKGEIACRREAYDSAAEHFVKPVSIEDDLP